MEERALYRVTISLFVRHDHARDAKRSAQDAADGAMLGAGGTVEAVQVLWGVTESSEAEMAAIAALWEEA